MPIFGGPEPVRLAPSRRVVVRHCQASAQLSLRAVPERCGHLCADEVSLTMSVVVVPRSSPTAAVQTQVSLTTSTPMGLLR